MKTHHGIVNRRSRQSGFSLLEVLIAIVVTSIGLLGLAAMQATGLRNNHSAYHRSQATVLAYDIADRMRANTSLEITYDRTDRSGTFVNTGAIDNYLTRFMTLSAADVQADCETASGCTIAQMAENDLANWNTALTTAIPGATATITCADEEVCLVENDPDVDEPNIYTISVNWDDNRDGLVDANDPGLQVSFQP